MKRNLSKTVPGIGEGERRQAVKEVNPSLIYCKNLYKCHKEPPPAQQ
jgi:hypothetical protein